MLRWVISSSRSWPIPVSRYRPGAWLLASLLLAGWPAVARAQAGLTQEEALRLAFPSPASIERRTSFLSDSDLVAIRGLAGPDVEISQSVVSFYVGSVGGNPIGVAYFDAHQVRSMQEIVMVVVAPDHTTRQVEILRFDEPPEYRASTAWLGQLRGKDLGPDLAIRKGIVNLTGATLTSRALVRSVRRVLAEDRIINPLGSR